MGSTLSRGKTKACDKDVVHLKKNLRFFEEEIMELRCRREQEGRAKMRLVSVFQAKEAEWKRERKRWKDEVRRLWKRLEEKEEMIRKLEEDAMVGVKGEKEWERERGKLLMVKQMSGRDETVEKWKRLYLAIKTELDNLICMTHQGERLWWGAEDNVMERLQRELKAKEETVKALRAQISAMENEGAKREREVDILRQSLKIMSNSERGHVTKISRSLHR